MQQSDGTQSLLRKALHAYFDGIMNESLHERCVDLINRLSEEERRNRSSHADEQPKRKAR